MAEVCFQSNITMQYIKKESRVMYQNLPQQNFNLNKHWIFYLSREAVQPTLYYIKEGLTSCIEKQKNRTMGYFTLY